VGSNPFQDVFITSKTCFREQGQRPLLDITESVQKNVGQILHTDGCPYRRNVGAP